ncbi:MAG: PilN domain-containing protein [Gallionella sp.]|jgi:type IV pilus assembly protein PilN|nr:PilN domain-containing protein [Gallionella sp.]MDP1593600.1 PilN domain-containing protein [Gallionella sp.]MDP1939203.1 PilN domain-containing protein [Gallionella sp.]
MIRINLLPYREERRRAKQMQFISLSALSLLLGVLVWGLVHAAISTQIDYQERRNAYLQEETAILDKQIAEIRKLREQTKSLLERKDAVEKLQSDRSQVVHLLDQMLRILPEGVYIKTLKQNGDAINLVGYAQSNARISTLMRAVEDSAWLEAPALVEIHAATAEGVRLSEFTLTFKLTKLQGADAVNADGVRN